MLHIDKLVVVGVGLIGGSFAAALKQAGAVGHVVGVGRNSDTLRIAMELGLIDSAAADIGAALPGADLVLLGMPVGQMPTVMQAMADNLPAKCVVTDAGSTKTDVLEYARQYLSGHLPYFVPAHPIAGAEHSGPRAAHADLYRQKTVVVCPQSESCTEAVDLVRRAWSICGGVVQSMDVQTHDRVFAAVSHLPHLLAFALVDELARRNNATTLFDFAASGFRDFTRIASSSPEMWRDICIANQAALLAELDAYREQLDHIRALLMAQDAVALETVFTHARQARNDWLAARGI